LHRVDLKRGTNGTADRVLVDDTILDKLIQALEGEMHALTVAECIGFVIGSGSRILAWSVGQGWFARHS